MTDDEIMQDLKDEYDKTFLSKKELENIIKGEYKKYL